ncbi:MAG: hypothetical protein PF572_06075 [Patescibacteria group bacterium]|jgi:hypothetical protein|nr:hypothetical protein [Patescibacteria group bacterium]
MTSKGFGNSEFAEGGTPNEDATGYARRSAIYKELGKTKSITDKMLAAGKSFLDQEAEQTEVAIRETIEDEEQYIITGDATTSPLQYDGLDSYISTNITDDNNNALGFRTDLIDAAIQTLLNSYGMRATAIYCSYGMQRAINNSLGGDVRVNLDQTNEVSSGVNVTSIQTSIGKLPIINTYGISDDSSTYAGSTVSDLYIVTEKARGQDALF